MLLHNLLLRLVYRCSTSHWSTQP